MLPRTPVCGPVGAGMVPYSSQGHAVLLNDIPYQLSCTIRCYAKRVETQTNIRAVPTPADSDYEPCRHLLPCYFAPRDTRSIYLTPYETECA